MRIVHINYSESSGGASVAAKRLHSALLAQNVDSWMLVSEKRSNSKNVVGYRKLKEKRSQIFNEALNKVWRHFFLGKVSPGFIGTRYGDHGLIRALEELKPDIIHLHHISSGTIPLHRLKSFDIPIVWSLHDMWPITAGCSYSGKCAGYQTECSRCPMVSKQIGVRRLFNLKKKLITAPDMHFVGLSKWMYNQVHNSTIGSSTNCHQLPNMISPLDYHPIDQQLCRSLLGITSTKKLIGFGAMSPTSDYRKGFDLLQKALTDADPSEFELAIIGTETPNEDYFPGIQTHYLGQLSDDISLKVYYGALDTFVSPSREENLSNMIMESLACGVPVAAYDIGGNRDMIQNGINGYLANIESPSTLFRAIKSCILLLKENEKNKVAISDNCNSRFGRDIVTKQYIKFYQEICNTL